jgi:molybdopterin/thiamine biosynthesis adenylyltransferase
MAGVIGCLQALEAIKYLTNLGRLLNGYLLTYDALNMDFRKIKVPLRPSCAVCGPNPTITKPFDYEQASCDLKG